MLAALRLTMNRALVSRLLTAVDASALERLRLRVLFAVALLKLFNFIGGAWDIQWHVAIGRDSLWIPPHLMVVAAFVSGLAIVVVMIAYETGVNWAATYTGLTANDVSIALNNATSQVSWVGAVAAVPSESTTFCRMTRRARWLRR